jgi:hypothetical protein
METKSLGILLSLLEMGQQTGVFLLEPPAGPSQSVKHWPMHPTSVDLVTLPSWYAFLSVKDGLVEQCRIFTPERRMILQGQEALEQLDRIHPLRYRQYNKTPAALLPPGPFPLASSDERQNAFSQDAEVGSSGFAGSARSAPPFSFAHQYPILTALGQVMLQQQSLSLSRNEGHLLRLCDGQRPIWRIADLLRVPPEEQQAFLQTIQQLVQRGLLDLSR